MTARLPPSCPFTPLHQLRSLGDHDDDLLYGLRGHRYWASDDLDTAEPYHARLDGYRDFHAA